MLELRQEQLGKDQPNQALIEDWHCPQMSLYDAQRLVEKELVGLSRFVKFGYRF